MKAAAEAIQLADEPTFRIGGLTVRPSLGEVSGPVGTERLEPRVMQVLVALARADGAVVSRDALIADCWGGVVVSENAIDRAIGKIRRLAERDGSGFRVETLPRIGVRLLPTDSAGPVDVPTPAAEPPPVSPPAPPRPSRRAALAMAGAGVAAAGGVGLWLARPRPASAASLVAVLPFDSEGGADAARLADGVSDAILSGLTRNGGIPVAARHSSFQFRGARKRGAAAALGASHLVDGSVTRLGHDMRVIAYLSDVARGVILWSEQFDAPVAQVFAVQDRIAARVAETLRVRVGRPSAVRTIDPVAYDLYTRAVLALEQPARDPLEQALAYLLQVVDRAPDFAPGWAGLAEAQRQRMLFFPAPLQPPERAASQRSAERALTLDPELGQVYGTLANLGPRFGRWAEVDRLYARGLALTPQSPTLRHLHAQFLMAVGRGGEALRALQALQRLNPLSAAVAVDVANALWDVGRRPEALAGIDRAHRLWPGIPIVWSERVRLNFSMNHFGATEALLNAPPPSVSAADPNVARRKLILRAKRDRRPDDVAAAIAAFEEFGRAGVWPGMIAIRALCELGEGRRAFAVADRLFRAEAGEGQRSGVNLMGTHTPGGEADPTVLFQGEFAPMRRQPGFVDILARIGLTAYWREAGVVPDILRQART